MTPFEKIELDFDSREEELATLRNLLANKHLADKQKMVLFRAGWALLYAHFEGFCKFALTVYFDALKSFRAKYSEFNPKIQAFALTEELRKIRELSSVELLSAMRSFERDTLDQPVDFPEVNIKSNLRSVVLTNLLEDADLEIKSLLTHNHALNTLVNRRNKISHGEWDIIQGYDYYIHHEEAVKDIMIDLALAIDQKISRT